MATGLDGDAVNCESVDVSVVVAVVVAINTDS